MRPVGIIELPVPIAGRIASSADGAVAREFRCGFAGEFRPRHCQQAVFRPRSRSERPRVTLRRSVRALPFGLRDAPPDGPAGESSRQPADRGGGRRFTPVGLEPTPPSLVYRRSIPLSYGGEVTLRSPLRWPK